VKTVEMNKKTAVIEFDVIELAVLANALREAAEAVDEGEFSPLMGATPAEAERLRSRIAAVVDELEW
jgi:hypothetical protein